MSRSPFVRGCLETGVALPSDLKSNLEVNGEELASVLYIFGGLPGTGKSTLSAALARDLKATYLRVDVIEQAMKNAGVWVDGPAGYVVGYDLASQNLKLGLDVIADTVNPISETRVAWRSVAESLEVPFVEIEVICSDEVEHRRRVSTRRADISGHILPTWEEVCTLRYDVWDRAHISIDTAHHTVTESLTMLRQKLELPFILM